MAEFTQIPISHYACSSNSLLKKTKVGTIKLLCNFTRVHGRILTIPHANLSKKRYRNYYQATLGTLTNYDEAVNDNEKCECPTRSVCKMCSNWNLNWNEWRSYQERTEKLSSTALAVHKSKNLIIPRRCFGEDDKEM